MPKTLSLVLLVIALTWSGTSLLANDQADRNIYIVDKESFDSLKKSNIDHYIKIQKIAETLGEQWLDKATEMLMLNDVAEMFYIADYPLAGTENKAMIVAVIEGQPYGLVIVVDPGQRLMRAPPVYPMKPRMRGLEGQVLVEFTVLKDGSVANAFARDTTSKLFNKAAIQSILKWKYVPFLESGIPIEKNGMQAIITFEIE